MLANVVVVVDWMDKYDDGVSTFIIDQLLNGTFFFNLTFNIAYLCFNCIFKFCNIIMCACVNYVREKKEEMLEEKQNYK